MPYARKRPIPMSATAALKRRVVLKVTGTAEKSRVPAMYHLIKTYPCQKASCKVNQLCTMETANLQTTAGFKSIEMLEKTFSLEDNRAHVKYFILQNIFFRHVFVIHQKSNYSPQDWL